MVVEYERFKDDWLQEWASRNRVVRFQGVITYGVPAFEEEVNSMSLFQLMEKLAEYQD